MAALITLALAKQHLRIPVDDTAHDPDIQSKADQSSAIIVDYLKAQADPAWTDTTVPLPVQAAMLIMLTHLYEHRGDDMTPTPTGSTPDEDVWNAIDRLLKRSRDPALA